MSASADAAMRTRLVTAVRSARPLRASTTATPVITSCSRPRRRRSIARACAGSAGLPSASPSIVTTVSAPRTMPSRRRAATARALSSARCATASASGPGASVSSRSAGITVNSATRERSSSRRLGEAEARIRMAGGVLGDDQRVGVGDDARLGVDRRPDVLGQVERMLVGLSIPVPHGSLDSLADEPVDILDGLLAGVHLLGGGDEAPRRAEAGDEGLIARHHRKHLAERPVNGGIEVQLAELGHPGLECHGAARHQPVTDQRVELLGEEQAGRALLERLDQVYRDEVEALRGTLEIAAGVLVPGLRARVLEGALVHLRQVLLAEVHHLAIDVHHDGAVDGRISEDLAEGRSLAAADDQPGLRRPLGGEHARVDEGLVIDEVLGLAGLDAAVEDQHLAVGRRLHDLHVLELGLRLDDGALDGVHMALDVRRGLEEPLVGLGSDQLSATEALFTIGTPGLRNIPRWSSTTEARSAPNCSTR